MVGGQEDMLVDIALDLAENGAALRPGTRVQSEAVP